MNDSKQTLPGVRDCEHQRRNGWVQILALPLPHRMKEAHRYYGVCAPTSQHPSLQGDRIEALQLKVRQPPCRERRSELAVPQADGTLGHRNF
jgi:hypothetical protein